MSKRVLVGVPTYGTSDMKCTLSMAKSLLSLQRIHPELIIDFHLTERMLITTARMVICKRAYEGGYDHLIWIDDDQLLRPSDLRVLFDAKVPAISALIYGRQYPYEPMAWDMLPSGKLKRVFGKDGQRYQQIIMTGLGCAIVNRDVIKATAGKSLLHTTKVQGEDAQYWKVVYEAGIPLILDNKVCVSHVRKDRTIVNRETRHNLWLEDIT